MNDARTTVNLYILCGLPFAGKTVLAKELVKIKGWVRVDLDEVKFELFGNDIKDENLEEKDWDQVYQHMYQRIQDQLKKGKTVVHDTGNFTKYERDLVRKIAKKLSLSTSVIWVNTPEVIARKRLSANNRTKDRFTVSELDFDDVVVEMEPPSPNENVLTYDSSIPPKDWIVQNL